MNPYNSVQLVGNELVIVVDPQVTRNQVSLKPDRDLPTRVWGSINSVLCYSAPIGAVAKAIVYMRAGDKLWLDARITFPVIRMTIGEGSSSSTKPSSSTSSSSKPPLPSSSSSATATITSLILRDIDTQKNLGNLGATVDISTLPKNVDIEALTNPSTVEKVEFRVDGANLRVENAKPYTIPLLRNSVLQAPFALAQRVLKASAFVGGKIVAERSLSVLFKQTTPSSSSSSKPPVTLPGIKIVNPVDGYTVAAPYYAVVRAMFTDEKLNQTSVGTDVDVDRVEFYANNRLFQTVTSPPWQAALTDQPAGKLELVARAYFKDKSVQNVPVGLSEKEEIARVDFYTNGVLLGTATEAPWQIPIKLDVGKLELEVRTVYKSGRRESKVTSLDVTDSSAKPLGDAPAAISGPIYGGGSFDGYNVSAISYVD